MYGLHARAKSQADRVAEDTQLYQQVHVAENRLSFRTYTATGRLYDGFDLERAADGRKHLTELPVVETPLRTCAGSEGPDGLPCTAKPR